MPSNARLDAIRDIAGLLSARRGPWKRLIDPADTQPEDGMGQLLAAIQKGKIVGRTRAQDRATGRLLNRLTLQVLMLEVGPPTDSVTWTNTYSTLRDIVAVYALLAYGRRKAAMHVLSGVLERAKQFEITFAEIVCLRLLRVNASLEGDLTSVVRLDRELLHLQNVQSVENAAESLEERVAAVLTKTSSRSARSAKRTLAYADTVDGYRQQYDRYILHITYYRLAARALQQMGDDVSTVRLCREARAYYLRHSRFSSPSRIGEFALKELVCLVALGRYATANKLIDTLRVQVSSNVPTWTVILRFKFQLHMRQSDLSNAARTCMEFRSLDATSKSALQRDTWLFNEANVFVMARIGIADAAEIAAIMGQQTVYVANVIRKLRSFARDKYGVDLGLHILQYLVCIQAVRYSDVVNMVDTLTTYHKRYLREPTLQRTSLFVRMLLRIPTNAFDAAAVSAACNDLLRQLSSLTIDDDAEMVPYERVWQAVLATLARNADGDRRRR